MVDYAVSYRIQAIMTILKETLKLKKEATKEKYGHQNLTTLSSEYKNLNNLKYVYSTNSSIIDLHALIQTGFSPRYGLLKQVIGTPSIKRLRKKRNSSISMLIPLGADAL